MKAVGYDDLYEKDSLKFGNWKTDYMFKPFHVK